MSTALQLAIPIDEFLDQVFTALIAADVDNLQQLEMQAPFVTPPRSEVRFARNRAIFAALLEMAPRNLRLLRRASAERSPETYRPRIQITGGSLDADQAALAQIVAAIDKQGAPFNELH